MPYGAIAAAVVAIGGTVYSQVEASKAAAEQKKANKKAERIEAVKGRAERANALRQNRITAAQIFAQAANGGVQGSSGVQGALASQDTRAAVDFNTSTGIDLLKKQQLEALSSADQYTGRSNTGSAVASLAGSFVSFGSKPSSTAGG